MSHSLTGACPMGAQVTTCISVSNSLRQQKLQVELYSCGYCTTYINQQSLVKMSQNIYIYKERIIYVYLEIIHSDEFTRLRIFVLFLSTFEKVRLFSRKSVRTRGIMTLSTVHCVAISNKMAIRRACKAEATVTSQRS